MSELKNQIYPYYKPYNELIYYSSPIKDNNIINKLFNFHKNLLNNNNAILHIHQNKFNININININQ